MLAFFQATQLNLFERFLTQARTGIDSTGITSGMQNVAYVVLLVGFLWQVYQSALHGGDVRGLGTGLIKYVVTAVVVMNYGTVFTTINQGFVNAGQLGKQCFRSGEPISKTGRMIFANTVQPGRISKDCGASSPGISRGLLDGTSDSCCLSASIRLSIVIFGFFYIFYGSILYIFGPIVIALMPLGGANRLAKSYIENIFIWNAWPILYGGFGALLTAVQMGQIGQMLNQNNFLGGLGNLEGSILIGIVSIVYSLAIAIIPFIAKRIVSGDVGSTAVAMVGTAVTALTAGAAGIEGAAAGVAAARAGSAGATSAGASSGATTAGSARALTSAAGGNQPAPPQQIPAASPSTATGFSLGNGSPTLEGHADQIRNSISDVMGTNSCRGGEQRGTDCRRSGRGRLADSIKLCAGITPRVASRSSAAARRGPSVHRYNLGTWTAYHAARIAAGSIAGATKRSADQE